MEKQEHMQALMDKLCLHEQRVLHEHMQAYMDKLCMHEEELKSEEHIQKAAIISAVILLIIPMVSSWLFCLATLMTYVIVHYTHNITKAKLIKLIEIADEKYGFKEWEDEYYGSKAI